MIEQGYTKLFSSIVTSTIWREDDKIRIVWITLLALKNRHGQVSGSIPGLASAANVSIQDCEASLAKLKSPDKYSRSQEFEGRRIADIDGGWQILNHMKYRNAMSEDERREYQRAWQQKYRKELADGTRKPSVDKSVDTFTSTLTHADTNGRVQIQSTPEIGTSNPPTYPNALGSGSKNGKPVLSEFQFWVNSLFHRKSTTYWSKKELDALKTIADVSTEDRLCLQKYYNPSNHPNGKDYRRRDVATFLNNFPGELDRARNFKEPKAF